MNTTNLSRCVAALALVAAAASCAAKVVIRPIVPEALDVSANQELALRARASGVQIYVCTAGSDAAQFGWKLKAPEADLFDGWRPEDRQALRRPDLGSLLTAARSARQ
jgi:hypothetical protein